jgi:hypothetical protein
MPRAFALLYRIVTSYIDGEPEVQDQEFDIERVFGDEYHFVGAIVCRGVREGKEQFLNRCPIVPSIGIIFEFLPWPP